ncbi:signal peptidase I [Streptomyces sp. NPDC058157]|uniref:signal peptidase I n=1 Tax=Streptomyces sp. NPDC058157 TaxID=3346360 RepID=UPI0036EB3C4A
MERQDGETVAGPEKEARGLRAALSELMWWGAALALVVSVGVSFWAYYAKGYRYVPILTSSMEPGIHKGALVITEPVRPEDIRAGQVIAFMPPEPWTPRDRLPTVHRVSEVVHDLGGMVHMSTRGDANDGPDPWQIDLTSGSGAYARTVHQVPCLGGWIVAVKSVGLVAGLSLAAGTVLLWSAVRRTLRARRSGTGEAVALPVPSDP